jgi:hypothetical protein
MVELKLLKEMIDWKRVVIVQCIGYLIAVLMLPITIRIIIDEFMGGKSYMTFPIVSFIVWLMLVVLPVLYVYNEKLRYRYICFMVLWVPLVVIFMLGVIGLLIFLVSLLL